MSSTDSSSNTSDTAGTLTGGMTESAGPTTDDPTTDSTESTTVEPTETTMEPTTDPTDPTDPTGGTGLPTCDGMPCVKLDVLFVVDNSATMYEEQKNLAANFGSMLSGLQSIDLGGGEFAPLDLNVMVTTTDMGHPSCTPFQPEGYDPNDGSPVSTPCTERLDHFTNLNDSVEETCLDVCPNPVGPSDMFIHVDDNGSNVPGDDVEAAFACIAPQGIVGCGYEAPLESMLQALDPMATWNGTDGFLREDAALAIVLITDESDCSVLGPEGYLYFSPDQESNPEVTQYWEVNPDTDQLQPTSAVCWNAGTTCIDSDLDGTYESCEEFSSGVLHPTTRYTSYLSSLLTDDRVVMMVALTGVPEVTSYNPSPPYEPQAGGVADLVYRVWDDGDIIDNDTPAHKEFLFGIGPGCTGMSQGEYTGQATPPLRIRNVCESLNLPDDPDTPDNDPKVRCCMDSICGSDFSSGLGCITGVLEQVADGG